VTSNKAIAGLIAYILFLWIAELSITYYSTVLGIVIHLILMFFLIYYSSIVENKEKSNFLQVLALPSLLRIISTSIPLIVLSDVAVIQFFIIYIPLLVAAFLLMRSQNLTMQDVGFTTKKIYLQLIIGATGLSFGLIEFLILMEWIHPIETTNFAEILIYAVILMIFTGLTEELIFRGILLSRIDVFFGTDKRIYSIIFVSVVFMLLHTGWKSITNLIFVFLIAVFYGIMFLKTKSIVGISVSHGITNIMLFVILPVIMPYLSLL